MGALCARPTMLLLLRSRLQVKPTQPIPHGRGVRCVNPVRWPGQPRRAYVGPGRKAPLGCSVGYAVAAFLTCCAQRTSALPCFCYVFVTLANCIFGTFASHFICPCCPRRKTRRSWSPLTSNRCCFLHPPSLSRSPPQHRTLPAGTPRPAQSASPRPAPCRASAAFPSRRRCKHKSSAKRTRLMKTHRVG